MENRNYRTVEIIIYCIYIKPVPMLKKTISDQNSKRLSYLSSYLRELRLNENQTMEQQSKQMNLHKNTILRAENSHNLTLISVFKFADEFNVPVYELFQDIE
jgi:hypothetical protein